MSIISKRCFKPFLVLVLITFAFQQPSFAVPIYENLNINSSGDGTKTASDESTITDLEICNFLEANGRTLSDVMTDPNITDNYAALDILVRVAREKISTGEAIRELAGLKADPDEAEAWVTIASNFRKGEVLEPFTGTTLVGKPEPVYYGVYNSGDTGVTLLDEGGSPILKNDGKPAVIPSGRTIDIGVMYSSEWYPHLSDVRQVFAEALGVELDGQGRPVGDEETQRNFRVTFGQFALLHETGHQVWDRMLAKYLGADDKKVNKENREAFSNLFAKAGLGFDIDDTLPPDEARIRENVKLVIPTLRGSERILLEGLLGDKPTLRYDGTGKSDLVAVLERVGIDTIPHMRDLTFKNESKRRELVAALHRAVDAGRLVAMAERPPRPEDIPNLPDDEFDRIRDKMFGKYPLEFMIDSARVAAMDRADFELMREVVLRDLKEKIRKMADFYMAAVVGEAIRTGSIDAYPFLAYMYNSAGNNDFEEIEENLEKRPRATAEQVNELVSTFTQTVMRNPRRRPTQIVSLLTEDFDLASPVDRNQFIPFANDVNAVLENFGLSYIFVTTNYNNRFVFAFGPCQKIKGKLFVMQEQEILSPFFPPAVTGTLSGEDWNVVYLNRTGAVLRKGYRPVFEEERARELRFHPLNLWLLKHMCALYDIKEPANLADERFEEAVAEEISSAMARDNGHAVTIGRIEARGLLRAYDTRLYGFPGGRSISDILADFCDEGRFDYIVSTFHQEPQKARRLLLAYLTDLVGKMTTVGAAQHGILTATVELLVTLSCMGPGLEIDFDRLAGLRREIYDSYYESLVERLPDINGIIQHKPVGALLSQQEALSIENIYKEVYRECLLDIFKRTAEGEVFETHEETKNYILSKLQQVADQDILGGFPEESERIARGEPLVPGGAITSSGTILPCYDISGLDSPGMLELIASIEDSLLGKVADGIVDVDVIALGGALSDRRIVTIPDIVSLVRSHYRNYLKKLDLTEAVITEKVGGIIGAMEEDGRLSRVEGTWVVLGAADLATDWQAPKLDEKGGGLPEGEEASLYRGQGDGGSPVEPRTKFKDVVDSAVPELRPIANFILSDSDVQDFNNVGCLRVTPSQVHPMTRKATEISITIENPTERKEFRRLAIAKIESITDVPTIYTLTTSYTHDFTRTPATTVTKTAEDPDGLEKIVAVDFATQKILWSRWVADARRISAQRQPTPIAQQLRQAIVDRKVMGWKETAELAHQMATDAGRNELATALQPLIDYPENYQGLDADQLRAEVGKLTRELTSGDDKDVIRICLLGLGQGSGPGEISLTFPYKINAITAEGEYMAIKEWEVRFAPTFLGRIETITEYFLTVYDLKTGMPVKGLERIRAAYGYSLTPTHLAVVGEWKDLTVYDLKTSEPVKDLQKLRVNTYYHNFHFLSPTHLAVVKEPGSCFTVYDLKTGKLVIEFPVRQIYEYTLTPTRLVVMFYEEEDRYSVTVYDLKTGESIRSFKCHYSRNCSLTPSHLAVESEDGTPVVYDLNTGKPLENLKGLEAADYFSLTSTHLAVVDHSSIPPDLTEKYKFVKRLTVYDLKTGTPFLTTSFYIYGGGVIYFNFALTPTHLAFVEPSATLTVYDLKTGDTLKGLEDVDASRIRSLSSTHLEWRDNHPQGGTHVFDLCSQKIIPELNAVPQFGPELTERFRRGEVALEVEGDTLVLRSSSTPQPTQLAQQLRQAIVDRRVVGWKETAGLAQQMATDAGRNELATALQPLIDYLENYQGLDADQLRAEVGKLTRELTSGDDKDVIRICLLGLGQGGGEALDFNIRNALVGRNLGKATHHMENLTEATQRQALETDLRDKLGIPQDVSLMGHLEFLCSPGISTSDKPLPTPTIAHTLLAAVVEQKPDIEPAALIGIAAKMEGHLESTLREHLARARPEVALAAGREGEPKWGDLGWNRDNMETIHNQSVATQQEASRLTEGRRLYVAIPRDLIPGIESQDQALGEFREQLDNWIGKKTNCRIIYDYDSSQLRGAIADGHIIVGGRPVKITTDNFLAYLDRDEVETLVQRGEIASLTENARVLPLRRLLPEQLAQLEGLANMGIAFLSMRSDQDNGPQIENLRGLWNSMVDIDFDVAEIGELIPLMFSDPSEFIRRLLKKMLLQMPDAQRFDPQQRLEFYRHAAVFLKKA